jgi:glycosyltransferase involved in cell wall biosynthesis
MKKVTIVIPAYNEERFIGRLLEKIRAVPTEHIGFEKEVIVVDDGSRDRTFDVASEFDGVTVVRQENQGKGRAVQAGVRQATGDFVLVQDADLEYNPDDYLPMLQATGNRSDVCVYGSRTLGQIRNGRSSMLGKHPDQGFGPWLAGVVLSLWTFLLYGRWITDTLTGYKLYPRPILETFNVVTHGFETDHELTAKLIRRDVDIVEVPVRYTPRSRAEGKKISMSDGVIAVWTLLRFRFRSAASL